MNCEKCQELIHDFLDGTISNNDESTLKSHLDECLECQSVRSDLDSIVGFCRAHRGDYAPVPNEQAMWLRIRNMVEVGNVQARETQVDRRPFFPGFFKRSWELSLPQLAALAAVIILVVSLGTAVGVRRWESTTQPAPVAETQMQATNVSDRVWQQQQVINYWNQRIELNKARWNPAMRETFDRNMKVIDQAVSESMNELNRNPHDEVSAQMLNDALNDKLSLLKEFSDL